jgi:uncharacterized phage protein gp47/JayE
MYGVTPEGFVVKPRDVILSEMNTQYTAAFGSTFDTSATSPDGQVIGIVADAIYETWLREERTFNNFIPSKSFGVGLDGLVELNGIKRIANQPTSASLLLTKVGVSITVPAGTQFKTDDGLIFISTFDAIVPTDGSITTKGIATTLGAIVVGPNEINGLVEPIGNLTVNNVEAATTGIIRETDVELRARRNRNTINRGTSSADAIYEAVADLNLEFVAIRENDTGNTVDGQPANSIQVIAEGGTPAEIARRIFDNKAGGIQAYGTEPSVVVIDDKGYEHLIAFSRPAEVPVFVEITIRKLAGASVEAVEAVQQALVDFINTLVIGEDVYWSRMFAPLYNIPFIVVDILDIGTTAGNPDPSNISVLFDERATLVLANILTTVIEP